MRGLASLALPALLLFAATACGPGDGTAGARTAPAPRAGANRGLTVLNPVGHRPFHDFGRVPFGGYVEHVFLVRNDDPSPVTIQDLLPSCGCAVPKIAFVDEAGHRVEGRSEAGEPLLTLPSGAAAELLVRVDTEQVMVLNTDKLAAVRMRSDSTTTPYLTFELHLVVERLFRAVPATIELGQTPQGFGKSGRTDVTIDLPGSRAEVTGIEKIEGPFEATVDATDIAGAPVWIVVATAKAGLPIGPVSGKVVLGVTGEDGTGVGTSFWIPVTAQIAPEVVLRPPALFFGAIEKGTAARVEAQLVALVPGERVHVTNFRVTTVPESAARWIAAEATPVDPVQDGSATTWMIALQSWPKLEDPAFSGTIVLETDHPVVKEIRAAFSGTVR